MGSDSHGYGARGMKSLLSIVIPAVAGPMVVSETVISFSATFKALAGFEEAKPGLATSLGSEFPYSAI